MRPELWKALIFAIAASILSLCAPLNECAYAAPEPLSNGFQGFKAIVLGDVVNVREDPSTNGKVLGNVTQGSPLDVLLFQNNWAKVKFQGREAWIAGWLIDIDLRSAGVQAEVARTDVNLREGPGTQFRVKCVTQRGNVFPAEAKRGAWIRVTLPEGGAAWVSEELVTLKVEAGAPAFPSPVTYQGDLVVYPVKDKVSVTQSPLKGSSAVGQLNRGESAKLIDSSGGWLVVELTGGSRGWVYGPEVRVASLADPSTSLGVSECAWTIGKYPVATVTHTDVNFRAGKGTSFPVIGTLQRGDVLRVIENSGDWLKCISPGGVTGWVASYLTGGVTNPAASQFSVTAEAGPSVRTLSVTGPFASAVVIPSADKRSVVISTSSFFGANAVLPVNSYEFGSLKVLGSDVTLSFQDRADYVVKANSSGKVVLEFRPSVTSIEVTANGDGDILTINTLGYAMPDVVRSGSSVTLSLPGASYVGTGLPAQGGIIRSVAVQSGANSTDVILTVAGNAPCLLKKAGNTIEAHFRGPGLQGKRIVVDPGHETDDPGAIGSTGLSERNVNWEIARRLVDLLRAAGADAVLTRSGLYVPSDAPAGWAPKPHEYGGSLAKRAAWSNGADLFISIHNDFNYDRSMCGTAAYVCSDTLNASESQRFAQLAMQELTRSLGTLDRGVRDSGFYVLRESSSPAVLVELMFISNPREESYLRSPTTWDMAASALLKSVQKYFSPGT